MLDKQLEISEQTADVMKRNVETMRAMKDAGMTNAAAVAQSEAAYAPGYRLSTGYPSKYPRSRKRPLHAFKTSTASYQTQHIGRAAITHTILCWRTFAAITNRPDVKAAEMNLASTYYNTNAARAAFYPQITISGSAGWTNSAGSVIVNPGKLLASVVGSLTQPLFYRGSNIARLKIAKAQQEEANIAFQQTVLNAGSEVSNALSLYQTTAEKTSARSTSSRICRKRRRIYKRIV